MQYSEGEAIQRSTKVNACHNAIFQNDDDDTIKCFFFVRKKPFTFAAFLDVFKKIKINLLTFPIEYYTKGGTYCTVTLFIHSN